MTKLAHGQLSCGIEYGVAPLPERRVVSFELRVLAGACADPPDKLGLARLTEDTLDKGTARRTGQQLLDAFDAIGAAAGSGTGRETTSFSCTVLPEHFDRAVELHAEFLRTASFPAEAFEVNRRLALQEFAALEDDAHALCDKLISLQAYGPILGRHPLGEPATLEAITRDDAVAFWRNHFHGGRMLLGVAGAVEPGQVADVFERYFEGFGDPKRTGRECFDVRYTSGTIHRHKPLEQEQMGLCFPGVPATHDDFPVQQVVVGVLAGGMSGRLFSEVREKQGLVYWVSAWQETPRGAGLVFLGASTTPERCDKTYQTLLREVDRLAEDLTEEELDRVKTGIAAQRETRGDTTRARGAELMSDLFHFGRPVDPEEKLAKIQAVTAADVARFLAEHPRDRLCVFTLGPRALSAEAPVGQAADARHAPPVP